jgi:hypothetical protein
MKNACDAKSATIFVLPICSKSNASATAAITSTPAATHINAAGPLVKVELLTDWGAPIHAEISHGRFSALGLNRDDEVFVRPREKKCSPNVLR